jgi:hypothetical protein
LYRLGLRLAMPTWFDLAFANCVPLLSQASFKFGPIHRLISSYRAECPALCAV